MTTGILTVFCPICERQVPLSDKPAPLHDGEANLQDEHQLVCLGFGQQCSGVECPVSGRPSVVMGVQLARSGVPPLVAFSTIRSHCEGCERITVMDIIDDEYASCTECRTTNHWLKTQ